MSAARTIDVTHRAAGCRPARDTRTFWRVLLAVIAPLPGVALAVANLLSPSANNANSDAQLNAILTHPDRVEAGMWIGVLFLLGLFPAIVAVLWVCRRHAPRLTAVVGCITLLGAAAGLSIPNSQLPDFVASQKGLDPRTILTLNDNLAKLPVVLITTLLFLLGVVLFGRILLGVLLWRSGVAPRWMASALILAGPLDVFAPSTLGVNNGGGALSWVLTAVGFAAASRALLRMSNDEFDLPAATTGTNDNLQPAAFDAAKPIIADAPPAPLKQS